MTINQGRVTGSPAEREMYKNMLCLCVACLNCQTHIVLQNIHLYYQDLFMCYWIYTHTQIGMESFLQWSLNELSITCVFKLHFLIGAYFFVMIFF